MEEKIKELRAAIEEAAAAVTDQAQLSDFWQKFLSKNGAVAGLTKSLRDVPKTIALPLARPSTSSSSGPRASIRPCPSRWSRLPWLPATPPKPWTSPCPRRFA